MHLVYAISLYSKNNISTKAKKMYYNLEWSPRVSKVICRKIIMVYQARGSAWTRSRSTNVGIHIYACVSKVMFQYFV